MIGGVGIVRDGKLLIIQKIIWEMLESSSFLNHSDERFWARPIHRALLFGQGLSGKFDALNDSLKSFAVCYDVLWP